MPTYEKVKDETLKHLDFYATHDDIVANYGKPTSDPMYSADTKLASVGLNAYVRRALLNSTNTKMRGLFPTTWQAVGLSDLEDADDIGSFIKLMCACARVAVPYGEPT